MVDYLCRAKVLLHNKEEHQTLVPCFALSLFIHCPHLNRKSLGEATQRLQGLRISRISMHHWAVGYFSGYEVCLGHSVVYIIH